MTAVILKVNQGLRVPRGLRLTGCRDLDPAVEGLPEIEAGADLRRADSGAGELEDGESGRRAEGGLEAEGRIVRLDEVEPRARARNRRRAGPARLE